MTTIQALPQICDGILGISRAEEYGDKFDDEKIRHARIPGQCVLHGAQVFDALI